jgi:hypothetical protein
MQGNGPIVLPLVSVFMTIVGLAGRGRAGPSRSESIQRRRSDPHSADDLRPDQVDAAEAA